MTISGKIIHISNYKWIPKTLDGVVSWLRSLPERHTIVIFSSCVAAILKFRGITTNWLNLVAKFQTRHHFSLLLAKLWFQFAATAIQRNIHYLSFNRRSCIFDSSTEGEFNLEALKVRPRWIALIQKGLSGHIMQIIERLVTSGTTSNLEERNRANLTKKL